MKLSIIVPVFNEEKTIKQVLVTLSKLDLTNTTKEIIIVNDGSTDASASVISNFKFPITNTRIIHHKKNYGKGVAIRTGIKYATGDYIVIQDADTEYNPQDLNRLIEPIVQGKAQVVYGTRLKRLPHFSKEERTLQFLLHYLGNKLLSLVTSILYGHWITDIETGYKVFPRKAIVSMKIQAKGFEFEPEITIKLIKSGYKIFEIPIVTTPRGYDQGKKLHTINDGIRAFITIVSHRFKN